MLRLLLPILLLAVLACGSGDDASDASDAAGEADVHVTFDSVTPDAEADAPPAQLCKARFRAQLPSTGPVRAPIVGPDGDLFAVSGDGAVRLSSEGLERWRHTVPPEGDASVVLGNPALLAGALVVATSQGMVVKLALQDGEERWRSPNLKQKVTTAPVLVGDTLLVAGTDALFYLREESPLKVFVDHVEGLDASPQQPVVQGATALIASGGQVLRRNAAGEGDALTVFEAATDSLTSPAVPLGDGRYVLGARWSADAAEHCGVVVLDPATGATSRVEVAGLIDGPSMLVTAGGGKVMGVTPSGEGVVLDLAAGTGARFALGGTAAGWPLVGNDGVWYLAVAQGEAGVKLTARSVGGEGGGQVLWTATEDGNQPGPLGLTTGGTVLFPVGLRLHGYRCGTSTLADSPWPKFQHDAANSGVF